jgi:hypothetical protein
MSNSIELRRLSYPNELQVQRELFVECFPENIGTPVISNEHYLWKFKSFPSDDMQPAYEYVAVEGKDMIAYYAAIPYPYIVQGRKVSAAMVCDVMTGLKARGKGVFTKLGLYSTEQFSKEGLAFSTGYPIRPEVIPGHKKAGWEFPFEIPMYGKFLKLNSFLESRGKGLFTLPANLALKVFNFFHKPVNFFRKGCIVEYYNNPEIVEIEGLDVFFDLWKSEQSIALDKSVKFLSWRLGAPEKKYHIIILRENEAIVGYSVMREVMKENVPCLGILDFCVLNNYKNQTAKLISEIENFAGSKHVELILTMMMKHDARHYGLRKYGFLKTPYPFSFIIKQFDQTIEKSFLIKESNWSLMWIDSDDL